MAGLVEYPSEVNNYELSKVACQKEMIDEMLVILRQACTSAVFGDLETCVHP